MFSISFNKIGLVRYPIVVKNATEILYLEKDRFSI